MARWDERGGPQKRLGLRFGMPIRSIASSHHPVICTILFGLSITDKCDSHSESNQTSGTHIVWHLVTDENAPTKVTKSTLTELKVVDITCEKYILGW